MTSLWWGIVIGAVATGILGGPIATRLSAILESRWDRGSDRRLAASPAMQREVERLAASSDLFQAYQAQYWSWAALVGGFGLGLAISGSAVAWWLDRSGLRDAAGVVVAVVAVGVGLITLFWVRKLVAKRRITRLVYRRRAAAGR